MATPRTGKPRGRPKNSRNKATIEREHRELEALRERASKPIKKLAKDELAELVPVVKGAVAHFQRAALKEDESGAPGRANFDPDAWKRLKEWIELYAKVADLAADFESPRYRAIAVAMTPGDPKPAQPIIEHEPADSEERERQANQSYLRLVKG